MEDLTSEQLNELARKEEAKYHREWRKRNPEKVRAIKDRYWMKKALAAQQADEKK